MAGVIYFEDLKLGMEHSRSRVITRQEIEAFGAACGDHNPVHFDEEYASNTMFGGVIAHGMLSAGLISAVLGEDLPGNGTIYLHQTLTFRAPVRPGDEVVATCTVAKLIPSRCKVVLDCVCKVGDRVVLDGQATVLAPSREALEKAA